jgi:hypothetical protein
MNIITASVLYAGPDHRPGAYRCYYCGAECAEWEREYYPDVLARVQARMHGGACPPCGCGG